MRSANSSQVCGDDEYIPLHRGAVRRMDAALRRLAGSRLCLPRALRVEAYHLPVRRGGIGLPCMERILERRAVAALQRIACDGHPLGRVVALTLQRSAQEEAMTTDSPWCSVAAPLVSETGAPIGGSRRTWATWAASMLERLNLCVLQHPLQDCRAVIGMSVPQAAAEGRASLRPGVRASFRLRDALTVEVFNHQVGRRLWAAGVTDVGQLCDDSGTRLPSHDALAARLFGSQTDTRIRRPEWYVALQRDL
jgi:hypothetical protein